MEAKEVSIMSTVIEADYKGKPLLVIQQVPDDKFPFQFGLKKAQLVLAHLDDIRRFVIKYQKA
jgi:hypothetical protein